MWDFLRENFLFLGEMYNRGERFEAYMLALMGLTVLGFLIVLALISPKTMFVFVVVTYVMIRLAKLILSKLATAAKNENYRENK